jgi:hypothetical protein
MGSKAPKAPTPIKPDIGKDITDYVAGYEKALPTVIGAEMEYRPQFGDLNLADISQYQQGLQKIRADDLTGMQAQAGQVRGLIGDISPEAQRMMQLQNMQAEQAYASSQGLTPQEKRASDQAVRESFGSAGRLGGNYAVGSELLSRDTFLTGKKQTASDLINRAYGTSQGFYSPAYSLLGNTTAGGLGLLGQSTPQMINPDTGVNIGSAYAQNVNNANMANAQAKASSKAGMFGAIGQVAGAAATAKVFFMCVPSGEVIDTIDGKKTIDNVLPGDEVIGFGGDKAIVLQKHSYKEDAESERFIKLSFDNGSSISLCDKHKVNGVESKDIKVGDCINKKTITSISYFKGVKVSYDLLTSDNGYQMNGIPVNSMIPEMIEKIIEIQTEQ